MDGIVFWYLLFAFTTSFASMYELIIPVMNVLEKEDPKNNVVENKIVAYITFFLFGVIIAPLMIVATIVPPLGDTFRKSLLKALHTPT
jgi:hypothetical protein